MLDTVKINHVQHISFTQPRLTDAVSVILRELLSYEHPSKSGGFFFCFVYFQFFRRANGYSSICLPRKDAATATSLRSVSEGREPSEFKSSTTQPETSPLPIIG